MRNHQKVYLSAFDGKNVTPVWSDRGGVFYLPFPLPPIPRRYWVRVSPQANLVFLGVSFGVF